MFKQTTDIYQTHEEGHTVTVTVTGINLFWFIPIYRHTKTELTK